MSYNIYDILREHGVGGDVDTSRLVLRVAGYYADKNSDAAYDIAEEFLQDHNADGEGAPEYAKGVYQGMLIVARKLREE